MTTIDGAKTAIRRRGAALVCGVVAMAVGTLAAFASPFSHSWQGLLVWPPSHLFLPYNDLWQSWDSSTFVAHGGYEHVFQSDFVLRTAPGWLLLTAPAARLESTLGLSTVRSLWWVVGPLYFSPLLVFFCAADRWMEGVALARRIVVLATAGLVLFPSTYQGHPEDVLAVGCALYALHDCRSGRLVAAGWWMGAALGFQLEAVLVLPLCLAIMNRKEWMTFAERAVIVPAALLVLPIAGGPRLALTRLLQLHYSVIPALASPLTHLLPGTFSAIWDLMILSGAVAVGCWVTTWKAVPRDRLLWALALVFSLRLLEPFFLDYYLTVALAVMVVATSFGAWWRQLVVSVDGVFLTWWLCFPMEGSWLHWLGVVALFGLGLGAAGLDVQQPSSQRPRLLNRLPITWSLSLPEGSRELPL